MGRKREPWLIPEQVIITPLTAMLRREGKNGTAISCDKLTDRMLADVRDDLPKQYENIDLQVIRDIAVNKFRKADAKRKARWEREGLFDPEYKRNKDMARDKRPDTAKAKLAKAIVLLQECYWKLEDGSQVKRDVKSFVTSQLGDDWQSVRPF
jgi:hypothetical protein